MKERGRKGVIMHFKANLRQCTSVIQYAGEARHHCRSAVQEKRKGTNVSSIN